jgi:hypothetical protein
MVGVTRCWLFGICTGAYTVLQYATLRKEITSVRLKPEQLKKLEKISAREDLPVSWLVRKAIDEFLKYKK